MRELKLKRVYRHFKGDYYLVEDIAHCSETGEPYVVYRKLYGDGGLWIRPGYVHGRGRQGEVPRRETEIPF